MKLKGLIGGSLILVLFALSGAEGAKWVKVGETDTSIVYVDNPSIKKLPQNMIRAWVKVERKDSTDPIKHLLGYIEYDCTEEKFRPLSVTTYYRNGTDTSKSPSEEQPWAYIIPESAMEIAFDFLCKK